MKSPKTVHQLAEAIESLVASYVGELRGAAQEAVERSFSRSSTRTRRLRRDGDRVADDTRAKRRSSAELGALCDKLYELVCARPGEAITVFAEETGFPLRELQLPMSKLKADGRIRTVGERTGTRYFPAVGRRSKTNA